MFQGEYPAHESINERVTGEGILCVMRSYLKPGMRAHFAQVELYEDRSAKTQRLFSRSMLRRYVFTLGVVGPARKHQRKADEVNAGSSTKEAVGSMYGGDGISVSDAGFVSQFGCQINTDPFFEIWRSFGGKTVTFLLCPGRFFRTLGIAGKSTTLLDAGFQFSSNSIV